MALSVVKYVIAAGVAHVINGVALPTVTFTEPVTVV
jgi:hypothetical protein